MILFDAIAPIEEAKDYVNGLDTVWVLLGAILVFWMQPGFALVEAGMTRAKNTANILMKNFCDFMCGSVLYWLVGFSLMYGADYMLFGWDGFCFIGSDSKAHRKVLMKRLSGIAAFPNKEKADAFSAAQKAKRDAAKAAPSEEVSA